MPMNSEASTTTAQKLSTPYHCQHERWLMS
jgi:hypothetical protein